MFNKAKANIKAQISQMLKLNTCEQFPICHLAIFWKNDCWRTFVTWLYSKKVSKNLFNISTF